MNLQVTNTQICYLCGSALLGAIEDIDHDHVPPKQFYPTDFRKNHKTSKLFRLPVHRKCNKSYQKDEDYFVKSIGILAQGSHAGNGIWKDLVHQYQRPEGKRLGQMIIKEFDKRPSGLYLPKGLIAKRFNPNRAWRIVWKITMRLFFKEYNRFLPEGTHRIFQVLYADQAPAPPFDAVLSTPSRGQYPDVFDYKYISVPEVHNSHIWAMLFWGKVIKLIAFQYPDCGCEVCSEARI
jgi:hypothetical protein